MPRAIQLCDPFHLDNLAVALSSLTAFGQTERNNHQQFYHQQVLQSIYDLFKLDPITHKEYMNTIMEDTDTYIGVKVMKEQVQRWLTNERNTSWVIKTFNVTKDNMSLLLLWAHMVGNQVTPENTRQINIDVIGMLQIPEVIVALNF